MTSSNLRLTPARCLHVIYGENAQVAWLTSCFPDPVLVWKEIVATGPAIGIASFDERAEFLETIYPTDQVDARSTLHRMSAVISAYQDCPEIVFWFGHEALVQINLYYLITLFQNPKNKISIVSQGTEFIASQSIRTRQALFEQRITVSKADRQTASLFWEAVAEKSPENLLTISFDERTALPFQETKLAHLTRFPSVENGLNHIEQLLLEGVYNGANIYSDLYQYYLLNDAYTYGCDEWVLWMRLNAMQGALRVSIPPEYYNNNNSQSRNQATITLTKAGHQLLNNEIDYIKTYGTDRWVGGVHLLGHGPVWRYSKPDSLVYT